MRRLLAVSLVAFGLAACGNQAASSTTTEPEKPTARLTVDYTPHNDRPAVRHWTLVCTSHGASGSHPRPAATCSEIASHPAALHPPVRACPFFIIRGAPKSHVSGRAFGRSVDLAANPACPAGTLRRLHLLLTGQ